MTVWEESVCIALGVQGYVLHTNSMVLQAFAGTISGMSSVRQTFSGRLF